MEKRNKAKKLIPVFILVAVLLAVLIPLGARAALSLNGAPARTVKVKNADIPMGSLIVGTYIIDIRGLTDYIYNAALDSASEFGQDGMYYKSELNSGQWYEISEASDIKDIQTKGDMVLNRDIEKLEFTHQTYANGTTKDLRTGEFVKPYSIPDPYDLENMQELQPILIQYNILTKKNEDDLTDSDKTYIELIKTLFSVDVTNDETKQDDLRLERLENLRQSLVANDSSNLLIETTENLMISVDATRRLIVYELLGDILDELLETSEGGKMIDWSKYIPSEEEEPTNNGLFGLLGRSFAPRDEEESSGDAEGSEEETPKNPLVVNTEIVQAIADSIENIETSYNTYNAKLIMDGSLPIAATRYKHYEAFGKRIDDNDLTSAQSEAEIIAHISNIAGDVVANVDGEIAFLENEFLATGKSFYENKITSGVSEDYRKARDDGASEAALQQYVTIQGDDVSAYLLEYEQLITAYTKRIPNAKAQEYTSSKLTEAEALKSQVRGDAAQGVLTASVDDYIAWLNKLMAELMGQASDDSSSKNLQNQKADLEKQIAQAYDDNDLAAAKRLEAQKAHIDEQIEQMDADNMNTINDPNASAVDKAIAEANLSGDGSAAAISKLGDEIAQAIRDGDNTTASDKLSQLGNLANLNPDAVDSAIDKISNALDNMKGSGSGDGSGSGNNNLSDLDKALNDVKNQNDKAKKNKKAPSLTDLQNMLDAALRNLFGSGIDGLSEEQGAALLVALQKLCWDYNSSEIDSWLSALAKGMYENGNPYVYLKYKDDTTVEYVPLRNIALIDEYRYIFDDSRFLGTLHKARTYFCFIGNSNNYETTGQELKTIKKKCEFYKTNKELYIYEEDSKEIFEKMAFYLTGEYGIVTTSDIENNAQAIYDALRPEASA